MNRLRFAMIIAYIIVLLFGLLLLIIFPRNYEIYVILWVLSLLLLIASLLVEDREKKASLNK